MAPHVPNNGVGQDLGKIKLFIMARIIDYLITLYQRQNTRANSVDCWMGDVERITRRGGYGLLQRSITIERDTMKKYSRKADVLTDSMRALPDTNQKQ